MKKEKSARARCRKRHRKGTPLWQEDLAAAQERIRRSSRFAEAKEILGDDAAVVACDEEQKDDLWKSRLAGEP